MKHILALDIATRTGWAVTNEMSGVWDLSIKRDESSGMRLVRFEAKLIELIEARDIRLVTYERVAGRFVSSVITASELVGVMKRVCETKHIPYRAFSAKEIKTFATGKGNSGKPAMIKAAEKMYKVEVIDDNHADALHILNLTISEYKGVDLKKSQMTHRKQQIIKQIKNKK